MAKSRRGRTPSPPKRTERPQVLGSQAWIEARDVGWTHQISAGFTCVHPPAVLAWPTRQLSVPTGDAVVMAAHKREGPKFSTDPHGLPGTQDTRGVGRE